MKNIFLFFTFFVLIFSLNIYSQTIKNDKKNLDKDNSYKIHKLYNEGVIFEQKGEKDKAIASYKGSIELGASFVDVFLNLALIYKTEGEFSEAIDIINDGIRKNENIDTLRNDLAKLYNNLGNVYRTQKLCDKAIKNFLKALSLDEKMIGPNLNIGHCYAEQNLDEQAKSYYLKEIQLHPDAITTFESYLNLGIYYREIKKNFDTAINYLNNAIRVNAQGYDRYKAYNSLANCFYLKGDVSSAIYNWQKVVEIAPHTELARIAQQNIDALK